MEIKKEIFGEDHIEYANSLLSLSNTLNKLRDYKEAQKLYLEALEIMK